MITSGNLPGICHSWTNTLKIMIGFEVCLPPNTSQLFEGFLDPESVAVDADI